MHCKITNSQLIPFMSFGKMPIANGFLKKENFNKEFFFNLEVGFSEKCSLSGNLFPGLSIYSEKKKKWKGREDINDTIFYW